MCKFLWNVCICRFFIFVYMFLVYEFFFMYDSCFWVWKVFSVFDVNKCFFVVLFMDLERRIWYNELYGNIYIKWYRIVVFRLSV